MTRRRTWEARIYDGPCRHDGQGKDKVTQAGYGTMHCPRCDASKGLDGQWRVLVDIPKKGDQRLQTP